MSLNTSTRETCPRPIWKHEVTMAAIAMGAAGEWTEQFNDKLNLWYHSGEPVWMAAEGLAFIARQAARADRLVQQKGEAL